MEHINANRFGIAATLPIVDLLLQKERRNYLIPKEIRTNKNVEKQSAFRLRLIKLLNDIFELLPKQNTMSIPQFATEGKIDISKVIALYKELYKFLNSDSHNKRLILYLPFELLPESTWNSPSGILNRVVNLFVESYLCNWKMMLEVYDIRANFVDGDILEEEHSAGLSPRVSKSAHLIPVLVQKGLLSVRKVFYLMERSNNYILRNSIADAINVLSDMNLLSQNNFKEMSESGDSLLRNLVVTLKNHQEKIISRETAENFEQLISKIGEQWNQNENDSKMDKPGKLPSRIKWEVQRNREVLINQCADEVLEFLVKNTLEVDKIIWMITVKSFVPYFVIFLVATRKFCEYLAESNLSRAKSIAERLLSRIKPEYMNFDAEIQEYTEITLHHFHNRGIIDRKTVVDFGISPNCLGERITTDDISLIPDVEKINRIVSLIVEKEEFSQFLYPIVILYGSKVKGYGSKFADSDIAFLIKPDISEEKMPMVHKLLSDILTQVDFVAKPLEFWLEKNGLDLRIRDFDSEDDLLGNSFLTHVLFQSLWIGPTKTIGDIFQKLTPRYLKPNDSNNSRIIWLEELERNVLQYRLMHKG